MSALSKAKDDLKQARGSSSRRLAKERQRQMAGTLTAAVTGGLMGQMKGRGIKIPGIPGLPPNMTLAVVAAAAAAFMKGGPARIALDVTKASVAIASYELGKGGGVSGVEGDEGDWGEGDEEVGWEAEASGIDDGGEMGDHEDD